MNKAVLFLMPFLLSACFRGADFRPDDHGVVEAKAPVINLPPSQNVNTDKLEKNISDRIITSSNATKAQLTGLVNAQVSKLGEKVTGLEATLSELIKINASVELNAQAEFRTRLDAALQAYTEIKAEMNNIIKVNNNMEAKLSAVAELNVKLGKISADLGVQAGFNNKIERKVDEVKQTFLSKAGRDVNMLPQQAVDIIIGSYRTFGITLLLLLVVATIVISMTYRYSRQRAEQRTEAERNDRKFYYDLLITTLGQLPPEQSGVIKEQLGQRNAGN